MLNDKQKEAYRLALNDNVDKVFITARAGFGKTYTANEIIKEIIQQKKSVICCAYSNKAKKNLAESLDMEVSEHTMVKIATNAVVNGYALQEVDGSESQEVDKDGGLMKVGEGLEADYIILDECGSTEDEHLKELEERCTKIICLGDKDQLKNISGKEPNFSQYETIELLENMRQGVESTKLTRRIDAYRDAVRSNNINLVKEPDDDTFDSSYDSLLKLFVNKNIDVIACFTNKKIDQYNEAIQEILTGSKSIKADDELILQRPMNKLVKDEETKKWKFEKQHDNGDSVLVQNASVNKYGHTEIFGDFGLKIIFSKDEFKDGIFHVWKNYYKDVYRWQMFKTVAVSASLPYAQSIYKLQGSTYENVGVNKQDIEIARNFDLDTYYRLMYVALSRAKNKAYVVG
jgi:ATP-dependent exoDNAse (exonuclease V) alpha subunit